MRPNIAASRAGRSSRAAVVALCLALAPAAHAQTTDPLFAGWRWAPPSVGSRPAGMGGAFVGIADSVKAAVVNPAGLALLPITEIGLSSGSPWAAAGFGRPGLRVAGYVARLDEAEVEQSELAPASQGQLESTVLEAGLAAGFQVHPRLKVGASLAWTRLRLDGERWLAGAEAPPLASVQADEGHLRATIGVLVAIVGTSSRTIPALRLGIAYQPGFDWTAQMTEASLARAIDVRRPSLISAGLAWRSSDRWSLAAQGDVIRYGEVMDTLARNTGGDVAGFSIGNVIEPRLGAEFAAPLWCGCGLVRLRGGLHYRSPGTLVYEGPDPALAQAFGRRNWRTVGTLGVSLLAEYFGHAVRLDLDSRDVVSSPDLSFGVVWRF